MSTNASLLQPFVSYPSLDVELIGRSAIDIAVVSCIPRNRIELTTGFFSMLRSRSLMRRSPIRELTLMFL